MVRQQNNDQLSEVAKAIETEIPAGEVNFYPQTALDPDQKKALLAEDEAIRKEKEAEEAGQRAELAIEEARQKDMKLRSPAKGYICGSRT
jgi:multidrug resistance efflux pump